MGQASAPEIRCPATDSLDWVIGTWVRETSRGQRFEAWSRVSPCTMEGLAFATGGGAERVTEYLRLEQFGVDLFYTAKTLENPMPTAFRLTSSGGSRFVFENPAHDFPTTITYSRIAADSLLVRIEGPMNGAPRSIDFRFVRQPSGQGARR